MATGRADFWYGRPFVVTDTPDEFNTQDAPTANWAYNHAVNSSAHHVRYSDAEAVLAMGTAGNLNPLHHNRYSNGEAYDVAETLVAEHKTVDDHSQYLRCDGSHAVVAPLYFDDTNDFAYIRRSGVVRLTFNSQPEAGLLLGLWDTPASVWRLYIDGSGNLLTVGTVDGVDISAHAANASAHHTRYTDAEAQAACRPVFVDRGDKNVNDKFTGDFAKDGAWHDLDLSAIVPAGSSAVVLKIKGQTTAAPGALVFRKNGNTGGETVSGLYTQVANVPTLASVFVALDAGRIVEYLASALTWTTLDLCVVGWLK